MDSGYFKRLQDLFDRALDVPDAERRAFLENTCADDPGMLQDVVDLLDAHFNASQLWQNPINLATAEQAVLYQPDDRVGPFRIVEQIGKGGMGIVYQAFDDRLQRHVALKFLPAYLHADKPSRQRFVAEARAASSLDHPNICMVHDINETEQGHLYIAMPHYIGETLAGRLQRGRMGLADALDVTIQVCDGLATAHERQIIHRDIKPANLFLTQDNLVKVLDFGIAKIADHKLTQTGMTVGTLAYMAPEQITGQAVDARADVWAVGVVLLEMLTGRNLFTGSNNQQALLAILDENPDVEIPETVFPIIQRALQTDREHRHPDMNSLLNELLDIHQLQNQGKGTFHLQSRTPRSQESGKYQWDPEFLHAVSGILMPTLGPIAGKLVSRLAADACTVEALTEALVETLPLEARAGFMEKMKSRAAMHTIPPSPQVMDSNGIRSGLELSLVQIGALESLLLQYIGPIAGSLIRRTLGKAANWDGLCHLLSENISDEKHKLQFIADMQKILTRSKQN